MSEKNIHDSLNRVKDYFVSSPDKALDTDKTSARLEKGLKCYIQQGDHSAVADMGLAMGGDCAGPSPGFFGRASLVSCVAMGIKIAAELRKLPIDSINVDIEMDWDNRGIFGLDDVSAGCMGMRMTVNVESPAAEADVRAVVDEGLKNDPWYLTFRDPQDIKTDIIIQGSAVEA